MTATKGCNLMTVVPECIFCCHGPLQWPTLAMISSIGSLVDLLTRLLSSAQLYTPSSRVNNEGSVTNLMQTSFYGLLWYLRVL